MPYPKHYLLSYGGQFTGAPEEVWQNNIRLAVDDNVDLATHTSLNDASMKSALDDCTAKIKTHLLNVDSGYGSGVNLTFVKLNEIGTDGRYKSSTTSYTKDVNPAAPTGATTGNWPLATALVVTFLTSRNRGPGSRGRVFIPQPGVTLANSNGRLTSAKCTAIATAWRTFLSGLNIGVPGSPIVPAVVSDRGEAGVAATINFARVGDVLDHMGSRRQKQKETYYTSATFN